MLKVAAVVRVAARTKRFAMAPHQRFNRPAVGGGGAAAELDMQVHRYACRMAEGVEFTLTSLAEQNEDGRWFVPAQTFASITCRIDLLERLPKATVPSCKGGWRLVDELPDTDKLSGIPMTDYTLTSDPRWQGDHKNGLEALAQKTRGGIG